MAPLLSPWVMSSIAAYLIQANEADGVWSSVRNASYVFYTFALNRKHPMMLEL